MGSHYTTLAATWLAEGIYSSLMKSGTVCSHMMEDSVFRGVITPNKIPLTTIVTYLQKRYRSRISNHWATIPACSVVPPIYKQSKKTYCHISSSDCQVRVRSAPWNLYGVNVTKAVIGSYMWQWWLVQILWHLPYVFSSFCCLMHYYTVTFATYWYMGWV